MRNPKKCECCGSTLSYRVITLYTGMVYALWRVFKYAKDKGRTRITRKEIKHLLIGNENDTARFGDWVMFGGLVHKEGRGKYIINKERCEKYFANELEIPNRIIKDPITKEVVEREDYRTVRQAENIRKFLDEDQMYVTQYRDAGSANISLF